MNFKNINFNNGKMIKIFSFVFLLLAILIVFSNLTTSAYAIDYYVNDTGGNDSFSGNITNPYKNIGKAVNMTNDGEGTDQIIIDSGIYSDVGNVGITINKSVSIYGAKYFDSSKEETIIDANENTRIFDISSATVNFYGIIFKNALGNNAGAIHTNSPLNIFNCTFINNKATNANENVGGAIFAEEDDDDKLTVVNSIFENNQANIGGAITKKGSGSLFVTNCIFINNVATTDGGAIYSSGKGEAPVLNSTFIENSASRGGALFFRGNDIDKVHNVTSCSFIENVASFGSAIYTWQGIALNISYSIFLNNSGYQVYNNSTAASLTFVADYNWWGSNNINGKIYGLTLNNYFTAVLKGDTQVAHNSNYQYSYFLALNGTNIYNSNAAKLPDFEATIVHPNGTSQIINAKSTCTWTYVLPNTNPITVSSSVHDEKLNLKSTVVTVPTSISVSSFNSFYGNTILLKATLNTKTTFAVGKTVNFYLNGVCIGSGKVDSNGIATFTYTSDFVGKKTFTAKFDGGLTSLTSNSASATMTKSKVSSVISKFAGKFNKKGYIKATLKDQNKKALAKKTVKFYIKGKYVGKAKTNNKGVVTLNIKKIKFKGKVSVVAKFNTDVSYASSKATKRVNIKK